MICYKVAIICYKREEFFLRSKLESLQFESEPWTSFYTAGGIIRELRKASGKQSQYASEGNMAQSDDVLDNYIHFTGGTSKLE
jgi:hypothetical protein